MKKRNIFIGILVIGLFLCLSMQVGSATTIRFTEYSAYCEHACSIYAADIDSDGDLDLLSGAMWGEDVTWWENDGTDSFTGHVIAVGTDGLLDPPPAGFPPYSLALYNKPCHIYAIDMDGDTDMDIVGAAWNLDDIRWWENDGSESFTLHTIDGNFDGASSAFAIDVDGDSDIDVLGTAEKADEIVWYENDGLESFTKHVIDTFSGAMVYAIDMDGDSDIDVLGATTWSGNEIAWWENDGTENFTKHSIGSGGIWDNSVYPVDLDEDGDIDVLHAANPDSISWWENDGTENFTSHIIAPSFSGAFSVYAEDIDSDGDLDVLGAAKNSGDITWWENDGSENFAGNAHTIDGAYDGACTVYAADIDGDTDMDVLGAAMRGDKITWWENIGEGYYGGELWKYNAGSAIESVIVVDSNGVIYFGNGAKVFAVNPDGSEKWNYSAVAGSVRNGLALSNNESVVYAVDDGWDVYAIYTATGIEKWHYGWSGGDDYPGLSGIVVDVNDSIYIGGDWHGLYSLDSDGNLRWTTDVGECHSGHAIGKTNTVVYYHDVGFGLREVQLANGNVNWVHSDVFVGSYGTGVSIASDGTIYYGSSGYFFAVNPDGSEKWNYSVNGYVGSNNAIGSNGNIWFVDRLNPSVVIVVKPDGTLVWEYTLSYWGGGAGWAATGLALDSDDIVYVGCYDNRLYAINPDGTLRWTYMTGGDVNSGIAFSPDESVIYFGSDDGYLYAITEGYTYQPSYGIYGWVYILPSYELSDHTAITCTNTTFTSSFTTNETGYYEFDNLNPDSYWINASKYGYKDNNAVVEVVSGFNETLLSNGDSL